ncbi:phosphoadenylyl-sulfate reductase [Pokkaliibacter sp. MBI-7]|uniref:phosphoadenylyl-sulfate reductase n=1 Tax=Pokkaliibacter sp. MBI-7 TaxID=3040600 RepID=UPI0024496C8F|nr:phosphoadenylyl-sulfate reductase [Pokkaliibacter sp. MBI-7]MDH2436577.1 phosphoadenylyl-sulfate reductase [Pokkaliibacter sp. MBI-7]
MSDNQARAALSEVLQAKIEHSIRLLQEAEGKYARVTFANSLGAEDVVITHLIARHAPAINMFCLDTGRLPEETLTLLADIQQQLSCRIQVFFPRPEDVEAYVSEHGVNAFYESIELRKACCHVRKVLPLKRALAGYDAWVTGIRREQSVTRDNVAFTERDLGNNMDKLNPLADWTEKEVWAYIRHFAVPYNILHDKFYPSIGCAPCTRSVTLGEDVRSGRWWWENADLRECGLHPGASTPLKQSAGSAGAAFSSLKRPD